MTNNNKLKIIIAILFCFILILAGMLIYVIHEKMSGNGDSPAGLNSDQAGMSANPGTSDEKLDLSLYLYDADDYNKPKEIKTVTIDKKLYQDDITAAINELLQSTGLKINKADVDGDSIVIDLPKDISAKFNEGSAGGITRTNILAMTILNLPQINKMKVTVDGAEGIVGDHFNFDGTFYKTQDGYEFN